MPRITSKQNKAISDTFDAAKAAALKAAVAAEVKEDDGKLFMKNRDGGMLMCDLTVQRREKAPDPLCVCVNEEIRWIKRGMKARVPWYVVLHMQNNIERKFRQEGEGKSRTIVAEDAPGEPFNYTQIDPADDNPQNVLL